MHVETEENAGNEGENTERLTRRKRGVGTREEEGSREG